jgi:Domain of unknown function (DUF3291)
MRASKKVFVFSLLLRKTMPIQNFYLAQINISRMHAPLDDPIMAEFANVLDRVNVIGDRSPGFIWRLKTDSGEEIEVSE